MQFLYRLEVVRAALLTEGPTPEEEAVLERHFTYLQHLTRAGVVLLAGRTTRPGGEGFGIVVFEAASEAEARERMHGDPAVASGVMRAALFPFRIALASRRPLLPPDAGGEAAEGLA